MRLQFALAALLLVSCAAAPPYASHQRDAAPVSPGRSGERVDAAARRLVAEGSIAGAVVLLARHGEVTHFEAYGHHDLETQRPMQRDALFRICSMSKAVTSVAALMLYEDGQFLLDDPIARFLPEFASPKVLVGPPAEEGCEPVLEPARRPITVRHLLTHSSGITYRFLGQPVISELYAEAGITDGLSETELDLAENVRRIAAQPLLHQPGERFSYGLSTDVLGRLVEAVSGEPLGVFLEQRVFGPLGMTDTGFTVREEDQERLPTIYRKGAGGDLEPLAQGPLVEGLLIYSTSYPHEGRSRYESGGAGLVTTAADFARLCQVLASHGEPGGVRLLGRKTVELMTANHIAALEQDPGHTFGLGVGLAKDPGLSGSIVTRGTWSWDGFYTTRFWIDPTEDFIGVILTQTFPTDTNRALDRLTAAAYQTLD